MDCCGFREYEPIEILSGYGRRYRSGIGWQRDNSSLLSSPGSSWRSSSERTIPPSCHRACCRPTPRGPERCFEISSNRPELVVPIRAGDHVVPNAIRALDDCDCDVVDVELRRPSLDDVFLAITGSSPDEMAGEQEVAS